MDAKPESKGCTIEMVRAAKPAAQKAFAAVGNLVGIGITRMGAGYGLKVNLESAPDGETSLPAEIAGVPVRVEIVGLPTKRTAGR